MTASLDPGLVIDLTAARAAPPLYPPTVQPPTRELSLPTYIARLIDNPLKVLPKAAYEDPIVFYGFLATRVYWVLAPELIEQVLLTDAATYIKSPLERRVLGPTLGQGMLTAPTATWRWQRKVAAPVFRHQEVVAFVPAMAAAAEVQIEAWARERTPGHVYEADIEYAMMTTTFDVIATTILAGCRPEEAATIKAADTAYMGRISWAIAVAVLKLPEWVWYPNKRVMRQAAITVRAGVAAIVDRRREEMARPGAQPPNDILTRLLSARDAQTGEPMSDTMMIDNLATFLEAGHQTTAQALTWALYLLARAPAWQDAGRAEIASVVGSEAIEGRHMSGLAITTRIFKEAMRLYPPVPAIVRSSTQKQTLGETTIPKGGSIVIPVFAVHRHRAYWDDPERFDPDRFLPEREAGRHRAGYIPFGFGPRTCIGMPFATLEGVAILASLLRRCRFHWDGKLAPEPLSQITLHPRGGMRLGVEML